MDRSIKIVRQLKQIFEPYRTIFKELKGKKKLHLSQSFLQRKKHWKIVRCCFGGGGGKLCADFRFSQGVLEPNPEKSEA